MFFFFFSNATRVLLCKSNWYKLENIIATSVFFVHRREWSPFAGQSEPTRTLISWKQGFRHPTRNEYMDWFAQIPFTLALIMVYQASRSCQFLPFERWAHLQIPFGCHMLYLYGGSTGACLLSIFLLSRTRQIRYSM